MNKKPIVGISMKTYKNDFDENMEYLKNMNEALADSSEVVDIFLLPSIGLVHSIARETKDSNVKLGAQNIGVLQNGAQTGEFAIDVLDGLPNIKYVELGHAERRTRLNESLDDVALKVRLTLDKGYSPVLCIGEKVKYESTQDLKQALTLEILESLKEANKEELEKVIIAYEPYWAIGQAEAADAEYVHRSHEIIYEIISENFGEEALKGFRVIYGGSVSADTVEGLVDSDYVDGVFVGRFGHDVNKFVEIVEKVRGIKNV